jgi:small subunit ribosomal protein S17
MKAIEGIVLSVKMQKTVIVEVVRRTPHPLYKKLVKKSKKFKVGLNGFEVKPGDKIKMSPTRPVSKSKNFKITELIGLPKKEGK